MLSNITLSPKPNVAFKGGDIEKFNQNKKLVLNAVNSLGGTASPAEIMEYTGIKNMTQVAEALSKLTKEGKLIKSEEWAGNNLTKTYSLAGKY